MIDLYCNQNITLKSKASVNEYNESTYTTSTIKGRFEYNRKLVRNAQGEQVISEAMLYSITAIKLDDVITYDSIDWNVISVANVVDLGGAISHYEVRL
jgi:hypothetical protein